MLRVHMNSLNLLGLGLHAWITIVTVFGLFTTLLLTKLRGDLFSQNYAPPMPA